MTADCLDTDALVTLAAALDWAPDRLEHVAACAQCRSALAELTGLHLQLAQVEGEVPFRPGVAPADVKGEVRGAVAQAGVGREAPAPAGAAGRRGHPFVSTATFLVAGATTSLLVLLLTGTSSVPLALGCAAAAGIASILPIRRPARRQEA